MTRYAPGEYRPQFGGFSFFPPVLKYMILINVGAFLVQNIFEGGVFTYGGMPIADWFAVHFYLWPLGSGAFHVWQVVTYMFLHGGFWHLFFNMLMLWMFGMEVENTWGSQKFLIFYFACGLAAGLANLLIAPLFATPGPTIGASGSVYGVLVAFAMMFPNRYVYIYFLLPVKAKYLITFFIALEVYNGMAGSIDGVAHIAHLGGAVLAAIWVILDNRGSIDSMIGLIQTRGSSRTKMQSSWTSTTREADFYDINTTAQDKTSDPEFTYYQKQIDDILDKISKQGYSGLTEEEKRLLLDASKKIHPDKGNGA